MENKNIKPFLKWAGGKLRLLDKLKAVFPKNFNRYIEPFFGAGSVALNVDCREIVVNDINSDLIGIWEFLREDPEKFVRECGYLFTSENNNANTFNVFRKEFNETEDKFRKAILFVWLNRHCFNGLCRYNSSGEFNVPYGSYAKPYFPKQELEVCSFFSKIFQIHNKDFREIFEIVKDGDLVYCDPPYLPLSTSSSFSKYVEGDFGLKEHYELAVCASDAADRGATVIISNHYNWYSCQLYTKMVPNSPKVITLDVQRNISANGDSRLPVKEIIVIFGQS